MPILALVDRGFNTRVAGRVGARGGVGQVLSDGNTLLLASVFLDLNVKKKKQPLAKSKTSRLHQLVGRQPPQSPYRCRTIGSQAWRD